MKQLIFCLALTALSSVGAIFVDPFMGICAYYFVSFLRPQFIWAWSLGEYANLRFAFIIGASTILGIFLHKTGFLTSRTDQEEAEAAEKPQAAFSAIHLAVLAFASWVAVTYFMA